MISLILAVRWLALIRIKSCRVIFFLLVTTGSGCHDYYFHLFLQSSWMLDPYLKYMFDLCIVICITFSLNVMTRDLLYLHVMDRWVKYENGALVEWCGQEKTEVIGESLIPLPLCPTQIPHGLNWTGASALRSRRLTSWDVATLYIWWSVVKCNTK